VDRAVIGAGDEYRRIRSPADVIGARRGRIAAAPASPAPRNAPLAVLRISLLMLVVAP
jgi:hypothetical protein